MRLRPYGTTDLPLLRALLGDAEMTRFLGGPESEDALAARHSRYLASDPDTNGLFTVLLGLEPVGWVGFWESLWDGAVQWECGWHIAGEHQGHGIATAAARLLLDEARTRSRHRFVDAFPSVANAASNALCQRLGFRDLGEADVEYPKGATMHARHWRFDLSPEPKYFTLTLDSLRAIGSWAADCAEGALPVYEMHAEADSRPRAAIEGIRAFSAGGKRAAQLRTLALAAHAAAREVGVPAAAAAARAAGAAAASAYTHPLVDVHQTKHIVGAAAYAALARELESGGDPGIGDAELLRALDRVTPEVRDVLLQMPARPVGRSRLDALMFELDAGVRARTFPGGG